MDVMKQKKKESLELLEKEKGKRIEDYQHSLKDLSGGVMRFLRK